MSHASARAAVDSSHSSHSRQVLRVGLGLTLASGTRRTRASSAQLQQS